jgi:hypothetical protein
MPAILNSRPVLIWRKMKYAFKLVPCKRTDPRYVEIRDRHYVENHGCIGRQKHYLIELDNEIIGIISGASPVWACSPRDNFFGINKENRVRLVGHNIVNNVVFRLEKSFPNIGTQILKEWRNRIALDWESSYGDKTIGFETFIFGENRTGAMYKADNWIYVGETKGNTKFKPHGAYGITERREVEKKLIFCKFI